MLPNVALVLVRDGSMYIDESGTDVVELRGAKYYRRQDNNAWVRKRAEERYGQYVGDPEVFKAFLDNDRFDEAERYFPRRFGAAGKPPSADTGPPVRRITPARLLRVVLGTVLAIGLLGYLAAIVRGAIPAAQRFSIADLAVLLVVAALVALLIWPQVLNRIQIFEVGGIKVEVRELKDQLEDVRFVLRMLVTEHERDHLVNLETGRTAHYQVTGDLQTELRRLRAADLIRSRKYIHDMPGGGASFELSEFVELTDRGKDYLKRMRDPLAGGGSAR